jgi:hypothetical protein
MRLPSAWLLLGLWWLYSRIVMGVGGVDGATQWVKYTQLFIQLDQCEFQGKAFTYEVKERFAGDKTSLRMQTRCVREGDAPPPALGGI